MKKYTFLIIDLILFLAFLAANNPNLTGIPVHEWLSLGLALLVLLHLTLHWNWLVSTLSRFFKLKSNLNRLNFVVDGLFFLSMICVTLSGLMISRTVLPLLGWSISPAFGWRNLHRLSANASLILLAIHFGLHWDWIAGTINRRILAPLHSASSPRSDPGQRMLEAIPVSEEDQRKEDDR